MNTKGKNTETKLFPFDSGKMSLREDVSLRRWRISYRRARRALERLETAGYVSAPFLRDVLNAFDELILSKNEEGCRCAGALVRSATETLNQASVSPRLKRFIRTGNSKHSDPACLVLKRVVREIERLAGDISNFDFNDRNRREHLKQDLVSVLASILTAERQALARA